MLAVTHLNSAHNLGAGPGTRYLPYQRAVLGGRRQMLRNPPATTAATPATRVVIRPDDPDSNSSTWDRIDRVQLAAGYRCRSIVAHWDKLELQLVKEGADVALQRTSRLVLQCGESKLLFVDFDHLYSSPQESRQAPEYIEKVRCS